MAPALSPAARPLRPWRPSANSVPICSGRRTQAITWRPAAARFLAMAVPMRPSPTNPMSPSAVPRPLDRSALCRPDAASVAVAEEKRREPDSALNMELLQITSVRTAMAAARCARYLRWYADHRGRQLLRARVAQRRQCFRKGLRGLAADC